MSEGSGQIGGASSEPTLESTITRLTRQVEFAEQNAVIAEGISERLMFNPQPPNAIPTPPGAERARPSAIIAGLNDIAYELERNIQRIRLAHDAINRKLGSRG